MADAVKMSDGTVDPARGNYDVPNQGLTLVHHCDFTRMVAPLSDRSFINADSANLVIVPEAIGFNYSGLESDPDYSVAVAEPEAHIPLTSRNARAARRAPREPVATRHAPRRHAPRRRAPRRHSP